MIEALICDRKFRPCVFKLGPLNFPHATVAKNNYDKLEVEHGIWRLDETREVNVTEEVRYNYEMVSEFYDKACQDAGITKQALKLQQKQRDQVPTKIMECYPALAKAEHWLRDHTSSIPLGTRLEIPVLCLRWTHATINRKMMFGHGGEDDESIFKLVDQLQRDVRQPSDINEPSTRACSAASSIGV